MIETRNFEHTRVVQYIWRTQNQIKDNLPYLFEKKLYHGVLFLLFCTLSVIHDYFLSYSSVLYTFLFLELLSNSSLLSFSVPHLYRTLPGEPISPTPSLHPLIYGHLLLYLYRIVFTPFPFLKTSTSSNTPTPRRISTGRIPTYSDL